MSNIAAFFLGVGGGLILGMILYVLLNDKP